MGFFNLVIIITSLLGLGASLFLLLALFMDSPLVTTIVLFVIGLLWWRSRIPTPRRMWRSYKRLLSKAEWEERVKTVVDATRRQEGLGCQHNRHIIVDHGVITVLPCPTCRAAFRRMPDSLSDPGVIRPNPSGETWWP